MDISSFLERLHGHLAGEDFNVDSIFGKFVTYSIPFLCIEAIVVVDSHHVVLVKRVLELGRYHHFTIVQLCVCVFWGGYMCCVY